MELKTSDLNPDISSVSQEQPSNTITADSSNSQAQPETLQIVSIWTLALEDMKDEETVPKENQISTEKLFTRKRKRIGWTFQKVEWKE